MLGKPNPKESLRVDVDVRGKPNPKESLKVDVDVLGKPNPQSTERARVRDLLKKQKGAPQNLG